MAQAVHRAFSFGTLAFLVIHIVTEILAQRSHVIDGVIPFLSPYRTFYIGLGTIASDLIVLLVVTSIVRKRFTEHGKAWRWRAIHYASYVAFVFAVLHGLLGGRTAKPYVDWSYGFAIAVTALGLAVRFLAISLRPKESLPPSPSADRARTAGSSLHAAAMGLAQAQLGGGIGGTVQVLPAGLGSQGTADSWAALPAPGWSSAPRPLPALGPAPSYSGSPADDYRDLGFMPLGAPPYRDIGSAGLRARPYLSADQARSAPSGPARQPLYEPGYDGPPRFEGAPRGHGDIPQDELSSYPYGPRERRPASPYPEGYPDRQGSGLRGVRPGIAEPAHPRAALPAPPRPGDRNSGPIPQLRTGSMTQPGPGPMPRSDTGPFPRAGQGPPPRNGMGPGTGPMPRAGTGPMPRADSGPMPRLGTGPMPRADSGPFPRAGQGPPPRNGMGPGTGPMPRMGTGPMPRLGRGPTPRFTGRPDTGPMPRPDTGGMPSRPGAGPMPPSGTGPMPSAGTGPIPRLGTGPMSRPGPVPRPDQPLPAGDPATGPRTGPPLRTARRGSHRANPTDPRYREMPGPTGGDEWR
jgi:hypothetical protein